MHRDGALSRAGSFLAVIFLSFFVFILLVEYKRV